MFKVGIDVGGTNTDAVLMDDRTVRARIKVPTSIDITQGVKDAIHAVLSEGGIAPKDISAVTIGTTHFTNALVEGRHLLPVGVIRIGAPATTGLPPFSGWPEALRNAVECHSEIIEGGYEFDGRPIAPFDPEAAAQAIRRCVASGAKAIAISCVFASMRDDLEQLCADIARTSAPDRPISLSSEIGRLGLLERENATILNAALRDLSHSVTNSFRAALEDLAIDAPFQISQNDGTPMGIDLVEQFPILTVASGPTNSMRGASFLTHLQEAVVIDIGGTTADVGVIAKSFPRESSLPVDIGGVRTNFRMPDMLAIGVGGGSRIRVVAQEPAAAHSMGGVVAIGPDSVGRELLTRALVFGGDDLTLTDLAVASGRLKVGDARLVAHLDPDMVNAGMEEFRRRLEDAVERMKTSADPVSVILVGGGAALFRGHLRGASEVLAPADGDVANAIGAAIAQVGGEVEKICSYDADGRDAALAAVREEACERARSAGASGELDILEIEETPLAYLPNNLVRLRIKVVSRTDGPANLEYL